jgi:uncharacterized protein YjiS (DUF1127 family)
LASILYFFSIKIAHLYQYKRRMPCHALALLEGSQSLPPLTRILMGLTKVVHNWEVQRRTRKSLAKLEDHLLKDIGISRHEAKVEWNKPFWWK